MSGRTLLSRQLDRRAFLGGAGFAAGAVVASTLVPLSVVHALPSESAVPLTAALADDPSWIGHVDDACGHWPRYAHSIPYGMARTLNRAPVHIDMVSEPYDHTLMV
jgi:hypothetical protein